MIFFVDANVVLYSATVSDYREPCRAVLQAINDGEATGRTSTAALEEVWHVEETGRAGDLNGLTASARTILAPLLAVTDDIFARALALDAPALGTNDRIHVATCLEHDIAVILSADSDFDAVDGLSRVDPLDEEGLAELRVRR